MGIELMECARQVGDYSGRFLWDDTSDNDLL